MDSKKPSDTIFLLVKWGGMGYDPEKKKSFIWLGYVMSTMFSSLLSAICAFNNVLFSDDTNERKVTSAQVTCSMLSIFMRQVYIAIRIRFLKEMTIEIDEVWKEVEDELNTKIEKPGKNIRKFFLCGALLYFFPLPVSIIEWWRENYGMPEEQQAMFPMDSPFPKTWKYPSFCLELWLEISGLLNECLNVTLFFSIAQYIGYFMRCLQAMLRVEKSHGKAIFKLHIRILSMVRKFNGLFSAQLFVVYVINITELSGRLFRLATEKSEGGDFMSNLMFCFAITYIPFVINLCGHLLETESERIYEAAYQNEWYEEKLERKKDLLILMTVAQQPMAFHFKHLITFGMPQFAAFCRAVYSFIAAIQQFVE